MLGFASLAMHPGRKAIVAHTGAGVVGMISFDYAALRTKRGRFFTGKSESPLTLRLLLFRRCDADGAAPVWSGQVELVLRLDFGYLI